MKRLPEYLTKLVQASRPSYQFTGAKEGWAEERGQRHHRNASSKMQNVGNAIA